MINYEHMRNCALIININTGKWSCFYVIDYKTKKIVKFYFCCNTFMRLILNAAVYLQLKS